MSAIETATQQLTQCLSRLQAITTAAEVAKTKARDSSALSAEESELLQLAYVAGHSVILLIGGLSNDLNRIATALEKKNGQSSQTELTGSLF